MKGKYKILISDIKREKNLEDNIKKYADELAAQYNCYAAVGVSMNYYTMKEKLAEQDGDNSDLFKYFSLITELINKHILGDARVDGEAFNVISELRGSVEYKMRVLTAFTDGYEIYEYILNRIEAGIKGGIEEADTGLAAAKMFNYVFSENDKVVINSKLQLLMAQLPVRMTRLKFNDIVARTLMIYTGGEKSSVDEFADMIRDTVLIRTPKGFEHEYPFLYHVYNDLCEADYKNMDEPAFDDLCKRLHQAADIIDAEASALMLLQEIINDVYAILLTVDFAREANGAKSGYKAALSILDACVESNSLDDVLNGMTDEFINVEGVQEDVYENIVILEAAFDDIREANQKLIDELGLTDMFMRLDKASMLLSTSLFVNLDTEDESEPDIADSAYIAELGDKLNGELTAHFKGRDKKVVRSMMAKLLSSMPIFMNTQQEIRDYFEYVLGSCNDDSELTACLRLISEFMEE